MGAVFDDESRAADLVIVPDVVGLPFTTARELAAAQGVGLAGSDLDGPSIGALAWPDNPIVRSQSPVKGAVIYRWDFVRVTLEGEPEPDRVPPRDDKPLSAGGAHAAAEVPSEHVVDLTSPTD